MDIDESVLGRRWLGPNIALDRQAEALVQRCGLAPAVGAVLARLGVSADTVDPYLTPKLRDHLPDPRSLRDMEQATKRLIEAIDRQEKIAIFADYDVDGACSAALLINWLRALGQRATLYVPDRIEEGYGPNPAAMKTLAKDHHLIICVDCGTLSFDAIDAATTADVIVLDHHLSEERLPDCLALVNPNRQDETGDLSHLCAAAVVFLNLVEANRLLRERGSATPDLIGMLDLVALATVADVAPLIGVNRAFVRQGLAVMGQRNRPGLSALSDVARLDRPPDAYHLGYVLGPRINAGGRVGRADLGARLLSTNDKHEAISIADKLDALNSERRSIEEQVRLAAFAQAQRREFHGPLVWAANEGWHPGVLGIVAARLKEATNRPAIVIGFENGVGKGSGRSVAGIDLGAEIQRLAREGLIEKGGGHRMAAGLSLTAAQLPAAMAQLSERLARQGADRLGAGELRLDGIIMADALTPELIEALEACGPFGMGAPAPRFVIPDARLSYLRRVGESHLKLQFHTGGARREAICFGAFDNALGPALERARDAKWHLAGRLELNHWGGRATPQLRLEDAAPAS